MPCGTLQSKKTAKRKSESPKESIRKYVLKISENQDEEVDIEAVKKAKGEVEMVKEVIEMAKQ